MTKGTIDLKAILAATAIQKLNPMQESMMKQIQKDNDILLVSPTGSGKTLGFLLPLVSQLKNNANQVQALIIAPTRELALQIESVFRSMKTDFKVNAFYGGHAFKVERNSLTNPPDVIVGTPGRLLDHIEKETLDPSTIKYLILDEFDKSLEFGFTSEMTKIVESLSSLKRNILTSATKAIEIPAFVPIKNLAEVNFITNEAPSERITIEKVISEDADKLNTFYKLICQVDKGSTSIVFANHRDAVERIDKHLRDNKVLSSMYHGGLDQVQREEELIKFRNGSTTVLVATDLAARGLDIPDVGNIVHYQKPLKKEDFTHRNGRTARVNTSGKVYVLLSENEDEPDFYPSNMNAVKLSNNFSTPSKPEFSTVYINRGKKDKINKMDVVGFLFKQGNLSKGELGMVEIKDFSAYAAVSRNKVNQVASSIADLKLKGKKFKLEILD